MEVDKNGKLNRLREKLREIKERHQQRQREREREREKKMTKNGKVWRVK